MRSFAKRSEHDRRLPISGMEYFARGGNERRSPGAERRNHGHGHGYDMLEPQVKYGARGSWVVQITGSNE